jgi:hypothetical protein
MSNFESDSKIQKQNLKNLKWKSIQTDLQSALSEWSDFESDHLQKTPEELQLEKVKSMIENIKQKLNQF